MAARRILADDGITQIVAIDVLALTPEEQAALLPQGCGGFFWMVAALEKQWLQYAPAAGAEPEPLSRGWYAKQILSSVARLRAIVAQGTTSNPEAWIILALRLGRLSEEAKWRFNLGGDIREGKKSHTRRRKAGQTTGPKTTAKAARNDVEIRKLARRWNSSDELQDQYPSASAYIRTKMKLPHHTIRRRIKAIR